MASIIDQLNSLIKTAKEAKLEPLRKTASESLDSIPDGTKPATTGAQVAANASAAKEMYPDNTVDTGAKDNVVGASITASTDGAAAASVNGQEGADGGELEVSKEADNGTEKVENKIASARAFATELRKIAEARVSPFSRFLIDSAKSSAHPQIKAAMEAMDDEGMADASADVLMQAIESGEIGEDEAAQILEEAVASGAISEEDLQGALGGGDSAEVPMDMGAMPPAGAPGAGAIPGGEMVAEEEIMDPAAGGAAADEVMSSKLASASIGPDSDKYITKLAEEFPDYVSAGYALGTKIAEAYIKRAEEEAVEEEEEETPEGEVKEEVVEEAAPTEGAPAEETEMMEMMGMPSATSPEEEQALAAVAQELGVSPEQVKALMSAEPAPMDKIASFKARARVAILSKIAVLQD